MSIGIINQLKKASVLQRGFGWRFYTESAKECILSLTPTTVTAGKGLVGCITTDHGGVFVRITTPYSVENLTAEELKQFSASVNEKLAGHQAQLHALGNNLRVIRRRPGVYVVLLDKTPLGIANVGSKVLELDESKRKKVYDVVPLLSVSKSVMFDLIEAVNGQRDINLGLPIHELNVSIDYMLA